MSKPTWFGKFKKLAGGGEGHYLKATDCSDKPRKLRPIPWVYEGDVVNCICYLEGWAETDEKNDDGSHKSKSVRFKPDAEQDEFDGYTWAMGKAFAGQKPQKQFPKPNTAFLAFDDLTQSIKVCAFSQSSIQSTLLAYMDEEDPFYISDWSGVNIIIGKPNPKENKYKVESRQIATKELPLLDWQKNALSDFKFSWNDYMNGDDPFENGDPYHEDVGNIKPKAALEQKVKPVKKEAKQEVKEETKENGKDFEPVENWKQLKTPKGKKLGDLDMDSLAQMKQFMEDNSMTSSVLYRAVKTGVIATIEGEGEDIPF